MKWKKLKQLFIINLFFRPKCSFICICKLYKYFKGSDSVCQALLGYENGKKKHNWQYYSSGHKLNFFFFFFNSCLNVSAGNYTFLSSWLSGYSLPEMLQKVKLPSTVCKTFVKLSAKSCDGQLRCNNHS